MRIWCIVERSGKPSDPAPVPEPAGGRETALRAAAVRSSRRGGPQSCLPGDALPRWTRASSRREWTRASAKYGGDMSEASPISVT